MPRHHIRQSARGRIVTREDYADDQAEYEVQCELARLGVENEPVPVCVYDGVCPKCGKQSIGQGSGFADETILFCDTSKGGCGKWGWENQEEAIRNVY